MVKATQVKVKKPTRGEWVAGWLIGKTDC
jgi:hypothetical protein